MTTFSILQPLRRFALVGTALASLTACSQGLDFDLRGTGGGFTTADAARAAATSSRPEPDDRGVISYPNYQVAVADQGDTIETVASRLGLDAATLASFNGIDQGVPLRDGEIIALPSRVAEPSTATGVAGASGTTQPGGVDINRLAGDAIDRAPQSSGNGDVRVAALPAAQSVPASQAATQPIRHKVVRGETAYTISRLYDVPVSSLAEWNGLGSDFAIREGQYLLIPVANKPAPTTVAAPPPVTQPGAGSPTPLPPSAANPLPESTAPTVAVEQEPEPEIDIGVQTKPSDVARMLYPVDGVIIREYSKGKNDGINIKSDPGSPVVSADQGTVAAITKSAEGIPIVVIRHEPELLTVYANVTDVSVEKGAKVTRGQPIAKLRDGDDAFVHFEVRRGFDSVDPAPFLQ